MKKSALKKIFYDSLKCGTGQAYLIANQNPQLNLYKLLVKGATTNFSYDGQSENSRAKYILDIININLDRDKIKKEVISKFLTEEFETWDYTHILDLIKLLAEEGNKLARNSLYEKFSTSLERDPYTFGYDEIIELDSFDGLSFVCNEYGKILLQNKEFAVDDYIVSEFQENKKELNVLSELKKLAKENKNIRCYLNTIEKNKTRGKTKLSYKKTNEKYKNIVDEVLDNKLLFMREFSKSELLELSRALVIETNKTVVEKLLWVFAYNKFQLDSGYILNLATKKLKNYRINELAINSLAFLKSLDIREFALSKIYKTNYYPSIYTDIFRSNYQEDDYKLLSNIATKFKCDHIIENLAISYCQIFTANKTTECKEPLEILYRKMNCGIHRNGIIEILNENLVLSKEICKEIKYDSYLETRNIKCRQHSV